MTAIILGVIAFLLFCITIDTGSIVKALWAVERAIREKK